MEAVTSEYQDDNLDGRGFKKKKNSPSRSTGHVAFSACPKAKLDGDSRGRGKVASLRRTGKRDVHI